jgi:signal transduction histidine kinase
VAPPKSQPPPGLDGLGAAIVDALPISLYIVDRDFRIVVWNAERERGPLGRPRATVLGRHLKDILPAQGFRATLPIMKAVFATGEPHEETIESREGARVFHVRRIPVFIGRKVSHVISWFDDLTDRRALEMRVIASDRLAYLGQLVAGVAHEVANPLAGIAGCAEALGSLAMKAPGGGPRREARAFRDLIRSEVARCERIVRFLLDAARPNPAPSADVGVIVETALRLLERHPAFSRVRVLSRIPKELPQARIDPDSLKQVVMALAVNAARAMPGGGTLTLRAARHGGDLALDVLDTGPGILPAIRARIFEPYFTTDSTKGTGLGLAIARSLVRGRGGDLFYRARSRSGGSFRVILKTEQERA